MVNTILFADDTVLIAKSKNELQKLVGVFDNECKKWKLKVNVKDSNTPPKQDITLKDIG